MNKNIETYFKKIIQGIESIEILDYAVRLNLFIKFRKEIRSGFESKVHFTIFRSGNLFLFSLIKNDEILGEDFTDVKPLSFLTSYGCYKFITMLEESKLSFGKGLFISNLKMSNKQGFELIRKFISNYKESHKEMTNHWKIITRTNSHKFYDSIKSANKLESKKVNFIELKKLHNLYKKNLKEVKEQYEKEVLRVTKRYRECVSHLTGREVKSE